MARAYTHPNKRTIEYIRDFFEKEGYQLLSTEYHNNKENLEIKHLKCGHIFEMRFNSFQNGQRCPECAKKIKQEKLRKNRYTDGGVRADPIEKNKKIIERCGDEFEMIDRICINENSIKD